MTALRTAPDAVLRSVADLTTVGLAELVDRAALQTRVDRKYLLTVTAAEAVVAGLAEAEQLRVLAEGEQRAFCYASQYLDTPELTGFHLAARGRRRRFKVRVRTYLDSGDSFLEVKTRGSRGQTVKERTPWTGGDDVFVDDVLQRAGIEQVPAAALRPTLCTGYLRTTLLLPATESRITVDTGLTWSLPGGRAVALPGMAIVETKSGAAASAADRHLWRHGHRPCRISKYGTGLAALRPGLPANRWHPVLSRHFPTQPTRHPEARNPA
ncbi:polyphosphate polymerase domain-containing protein [Modestobacter sp. VKM Ac-2985]|uniref:polyphosphate polymerase domain-containing protein n=1 Tax=Modestobacter sp. VKM Ac-2985 TaxID=3004139 RepID=UPI0022AB8A27|nr:polyphosphate polymerase domain-containing protein [Modestobacter sp. VKM Ac-2985]MCZ2836582.1 polyphosphate polymerase domain-containing protein [Modestobacter sp. VKM Ac-2985]